LLIEHNHIMFSRRGEARGKCDSIFTPEPSTPDETEHFFPQEKSGGVGVGERKKEAVGLGIDF
jgi:hypothetical protein